MDRSLYNCIISGNNNEQLKPVVIEPPGVGFIPLKNGNVWPLTNVTAYQCQVVQVETYCLESCAYTSCIDLDTFYFQTTQH